MLHTFTITTTRRDEIVDITGKVAELAAGERLQDGFAIVYCPHTTAGIAINEKPIPT